MHSGGVERVAAVHHAQKACGLFEGFIAQARHLEQFGAGFERAVGVTEGDDVLRQGGVEA